MSPYSRIIQEVVVYSAKFVLEHFALRKMTMRHARKAPEGLRDAAALTETK